MVIPYVTTAEFDQQLSTHPEQANDRSLEGSKEFFGLDPVALQAAIRANLDTPLGQNLDVAGESIRKLIAKMDNYILPPEFDFIRNPETTPIVMYIFEFSHMFDKDDLSYMWQNLAPRDYKRIYFEEQSIAHRLDTSELLHANHLLGSFTFGGSTAEVPEVRFMVFKVKQKAVGDYNKHVLEQADNISMKISGIELTTPSNLRSKYRDLGIPIGSGYDGQPGAFYGGPVQPAEAVAIRQKKKLVPQEMLESCSLHNHVSKNTKCSTTGHMTISLL